MGYASKGHWHPSVYSRLDVHCAGKELGFVVNPYDDLGMEVGGPNRPLLKRLYLEFNEWLLDYNRGRMERVFGNAWDRCV
jgi:hypothetical protein